MRVGAAYTQTGVLAKGRAKGSAGEIEGLGRELGLAGASPPPKAGTRREAGTATQEGRTSQKEKLRLVWFHWPLAWV